MKKLIVVMFALGMFLVMASMYLKHTEIGPQQRSIIKNSDMGYSDIPEAGGL